MSEVSLVAIRQLVEQLAHAESALAAATSGMVDSIVDRGGQNYLLREAQQALLASEATAREKASLLGAILDSAPDLIAFLDRSRVIRFQNRSFGNQRSDELIGRDWLSFQLPDQRDAHAAAFAQVVSTGERVVREGPGRGLDGGGVEVYSWHFGPVVEAGQVAGVVVIAREVTAQKDAEAQLVASERLASIGTLAAGVAHEINNPLAAVIANLDLAMDDLSRLHESGALSAQLQSELGDARGAADRVRQIVRDLRIFSRSGDDKSQPVDVEAVLDTTLRIADNEIRHRARLVRDYATVPPVLANASRLGQIFLNLVVNAAQAIPDGNAETNWIRVGTSLRADGRVVVSIADSGTGIPPDAAQHIFEPFFTTKPAGMGTGLGLSICRRLVDAIGGEIGFRSEVGRGTEFRVTMPASEAEAPPPPPPVKQRAPLRAVSAPRGRVLVVDDEVSVSNVVNRLLSRDHDVVVENESPRALALLHKGARFDVILCDVMIPQMTGIELYEEVKRLDPAQAERMVFMTGGTFTGRAREFFESCLNLRIDKPFDVGKLRALVNRMVADATAGRP